MTSTVPFFMGAFNLFIVVAWVFTAVYALLWVDELIGRWFQLKQSPLDFLFTKQVGVIRWVGRKVKRSKK